MEQAVQIFAIIQLAVVGISHIIQPRAWANFFMQLRKLGESSAFAIAMPTLALGSFIAAFHNVWEGIPVLLTVYGWALVVKATVYLIFPRVGLEMLQRVSQDRAQMFIIPGILMLALACLLLFHLAFALGAV